LFGFKLIFAFGPSAYFFLAPPPIPPPPLQLTEPEMYTFFTYLYLTLSSSCVSARCSPIFGDGSGTNEDDRKKA
jgi:hypothetical protein